MRTTELCQSTSRTVADYKNYLKPVSLGVVCFKTRANHNVIFYKIWLYYLFLRGNSNGLGLSLQEDYGYSCNSSYQHWFSNEKFIKLMRTTELQNIELIRTLTLLQSSITSLWACSVEFSSFFHISLVPLSEWVVTKLFVFRKHTMLLNKWGLCEIKE